MEKKSYKILYHHRTMAEGAEGVHIREMVQSFRNLGHTVIVDELYPAQQVNGERKPGLKARIIAAVRWGIPQWLYEILQLLLNGYTFVSFYRKIRTHRPDFIYKRHSQFDIGPILAARLARVPVILEANSCFTSFESLKFEAMKLKRLGRWSERLTFNKSDIIFAVSSPLKRKILQLGIPEDKVVVLPNGANYKKFDPARIRPEEQKTVARKYGIDTERFILGFVGSLRKWHGLDFLFEVFADMAPNYPEMQLVVVGDGPIREELRELTRKLGIEQRVTFTGNVVHDEMPVVVSLFQVAVLPAEYRNHASPMKILEYMAMEKVVVAPDMENIRNIIDPGQNGVLFQPNSHDDLKAKIEMIYRDYPTYQKLGKNARLKIMEDLNWDNNARKVMDITLRKVGMHDEPIYSQKPGILSG